MKKSQIINKLKSEKGMTNVQLAITIVVILVLAGTTIFLILGENGFNFSTKIEEETESKIEAEEKEEKTEEIDNTVYGG